MANVFGGGSASSHSGSGVSRVIPTSRELSTSNQTFTSQTNVFASPQQTGVDGVNLRDFYTKSEVQKLLRTKADVLAAATKEELNSVKLSLEQKFAEDISVFITSDEADIKISNLFEDVQNYLAENYTESRYIYTKSDIDEKFRQIELNSEDLIKTSPDSTEENTIDPQGKYAIPLTVKGSSHPDISSIQQWIDSENNSVARIKSNGDSEFYGAMLLGTNVETWRPALDVNERRIAKVADPVHRLDAVNKKYMEDTIANVVDEVIREGDFVFTIDCLEY